jgi:fatty-acyl-CoA synthase
MYGTVSEDVVLNGFPLFHVAGSFVYGLSTLLSGGELVLPTLTGMRNKGFVDRYWSFVDKHRVTLLATVPTVISALLALPPTQADRSSVRMLLTGGSPLPDELASAFEQRYGVGVRNIFGMTECAGVIAIEPASGPRIPGSCGLALPFTRVYTVTSDGVELPTGKVGVLCVTGPNVGPGYTEASTNAGTFTEHGELITGDMGYVDEDGRVFITGRAKDVIIRSSHNIDPQVIENALLRHPEVLMASAVGAPDEYAGEVPVAFVVLKPNAAVTEDALRLYANQYIPERPAYPKRIEFVASIPMTAIGKIYKPDLKAKAIVRVITDRLNAADVGGDVSVAVVHESGRMTVVFRPVKLATKSTTLNASIKHLMGGFALQYRIES